MTPATQSRAPTVPTDKNADSVERLYWLSKVDEDLPRAAVVPDRKRTTTVSRTYGGVEFDLDPEAVRMLRGVHPVRGVSDAEVCGGLLAMLLGKYQREDQLVVGLMCSPFADTSKQPLPLTLSCAAADTFASATEAVASQLVEMARHSTASVRDLPQILGMEVGSHRYPLFDVALGVAQGGAAIDLNAYPVDLAFLFDTGAGRISGRLLYAQDLYDKATIERLVAQLRRIAEQVMRSPGAALREIQMMTPAERDQVQVGFNSHVSDYPLSQTFHALFEAQAQRTPQAIATIHRDARLSYAELNERANRLAHTMLSQGLKKGAFVGILLHRGCDFVVAMLAVFKAGGAYVPLDPTYPSGRVAYMLDDSEAAFLVTDAVLGAQFGDMLGHCARLRVALSTSGRLEGDVWNGSAVTRVQPEQLAGARAHNPGLGLVGRDRAYMIYTSGSTGRPKGAICRHDGALNHLFGELEGIDVKAAFNFLQTAASSSDISVWQFMAPLLYGGATVVADYEAVVDPVLLLQLMREHRVTVAEPVPVVLRALIDHLATLPEAQRALPELACMMCTGEALPGELVDRWLALFPHIPIANTYGPTETSDDVTLHVLREPIAHRFAVTPIGRPLPNVRIFVLDRELGVVPVGVPGEICIGGVAVGEGYWQQPEKTLAAFVPCPYPELASGLMYRTGDLGRWLPDGTIEFLGRIDQQVKVRGFRIEPGEIEDVLTQHPSVQDAAVVAVADEGGNRRLVGHYVARTDMPIAAGELRQYLKGKLADHMVPALLVPLRALPLTPLGKVDRRALSRMDVSAPDADSYAPPRDDNERVVADIWARVVGAVRVGIYDNFFEIGGDSILTIHVVSMLRAHGFKVAPKDVFRHPTVAELAAQLGMAGAPDATPAAVSTLAGVDQGWDLPRWREALSPLFPDLDDVFPLSATQRGIYFQSLLVPKGSGAYVEQVTFDLEGGLDPTAFQNAWQQVAQALDCLRTAVVRRGAPFPLQAVVRNVNMAPSFLDLCELDTERQQRRLTALTAEDRMKGFDLKRPPLCRVTLVRLGPASWHVLWTYHHVILDGWAEPLVLRSVFKAYDAIRAGREPQVEAGLGYRDFVAWSEALDPRASEPYWRAQLAGFTTPVTIIDRSPAVMPPSGGEPSHGWAHLELPAVQQTLLERVARRNGLTMSTILHGAWALLLHRHSGVEDLMFGSVASGRQCDLEGIASVRGLVAVTQPLRTRVPGDATVASWLRLVQLQMAEMREHEHTPLAAIQQWSEVPAEKRPMFDTIVVVGNYAGSDLADCRSGTLEIGKVSYVTQPLFAFTLFAMTEPTLSITLVYEKKRCASSTARTLLDEFCQILSDIGENPERRIAGWRATGSEAAVT